MFRHVILKMIATKWTSDSSRVHQIHFLLRIHQTPIGGAYSTPQIPSWFKGPTSKGWQGIGKKLKGGREQKRGMVEKGRRVGTPTLLIPAQMFMMSNATFKCNIKHNIIKQILVLDACGIC